MNADVWRCLCYSDAFDIDGMCLWAQPMYKTMGVGVLTFVLLYAATVCCPLCLLVFCFLIGHFLF